MSAVVAKGEASEGDARQSPRVRWPAAGRYVLDDRIEHHCRSIDISSGGVSLMAPAHGRIGQRVVCYLDHFGRMEGRIVRLFDGGFAMELTASASKRQKLAHQIAWHAGRVPPPKDEGRRDERIVPLKKRVVLQMADRRQLAVQIINLSRVGAAFKSPVALTIGDAVTLGRRPANVTRTAQRLIGVDFVTPIPLDEFDDAIEL
jgi:hypothetical protein